MTAPKITILGARGMLGSDLTKICTDHGFNPTALDLPEFDITNNEMLKNIVDQTDIIINCAAYTNVDGAESHHDLAYAINAEAVGRLGEFAKAADKAVLHISTDFVFDGFSSEPYIETDSTNPLNVYGQTKLKGEQLLLATGAKACIIRVEWTYGRAGNNFIKKIISASESAKPLRVVDDQIGSPTATTEVSKTVCKLLKSPAGLPEGTFHFAAADFASRYETAEFIFGKLAIDVNLTPCKTSDFQSPAARPLNSRFCCDKITAVLGEPIRPWQKTLEEYLERL